MNLEERSRLLGLYMIGKNATVRKTAKTFGISRSTVYKDITKQLEKVDIKLAKEVRKVLKRNKEERHLRGGMATKLKFEAMKAAK